MRALSLIGAACCALLLSVGCYEHKSEREVVPAPVAQAGDGPLLDRVPGAQGPVIFDHGGHMGYGFACTDCHHTTPAGGFPAEGCVGCHPAPGDDDPAHGGPDDNMVLVGDTQDTAELSGVPFNHYTHGSSHGYKLACESCHHVGGNIPCDTCHGEIAKLQGEQVVPKLKRAMHLQCKGCHESLVGSNPDSIAPVDCDSCHTAQQPERLEGALSFERACHLSCVTCHQQVQAEKPKAPTACVSCHVEGTDAAPPAEDAEAVEECEGDCPEAEACEGEDCEEQEVEPEAEEAEPEAAEAPVEEPTEAAPAPAPEPEPEPEPAPSGGGPADVVWAGSMGTVTFKHSTHGSTSCDGCHPGMAPMSSAKMGMEKGHAACSSCHPEVTGNCAKCHIQ